MSRFMLWLSFRVALYFSEGYKAPLGRHGLKWTLELIDEDIEKYGNAYVHQVAKAGCILRAQHMK